MDAQPSPCRAVWTGWNITVIVFVGRLKRAAANIICIYLIEHNPHSLWSWRESPVNRADPALVEPGSTLTVHEEVDLTILRHSVDHTWEVKTYTKAEHLGIQWGHVQYNTTGFYIWLVSPNRKFPF